MPVYPVRLVSHRGLGFSPGVAQGLSCFALVAWLSVSWAGGLQGSVVSAEASSSADAGRGGDLAPSDRAAIRRWSLEQRRELGGSAHSGGLSGEPPGATAVHSSPGAELTPEQRRLLRQQIRAQRGWHSWRGVRPDVRPGVQPGVQPNAQPNVRSNGSAR